jgi:glycerol dehydrogenase
MQKVLISPSRYVQGAGELKNIGKYVKQFGGNAALIANQEDYDRVKETVDSGIAEEQVELTFIPFGGECTHKEIERITEICKEKKVGLVIGLGGGKALDTGKMVAFNCGVRSLVAPTIAATDAPTSKTTVVYTENGEFEVYMYQDFNPDVVLVDTAVIAKAPVRFLKSGIGDALATVFEARACSKGNKLNVPGGHPTKTAMAIAELCYETLLEDSEKAIAACELGVVTQALENIVEANILMSGLGFESSGLAGSHAFADGFTLLEDAHDYMHGEKVAFGVICQLVLENAPQELLDEVLDFCYVVGLPMSLADMNCPDVSEEELRAAAELACSDRDTMSNMPFDVSVQEAIDAIKVADYIGRQYKGEA